MERKNISLGGTHKKRRKINCWMGFRGRGKGKGKMEEVEK